MKNYYLLHRDTNHNPWLRKRRVSWCRWVAKQIYPKLDVGEYVYFKTFEEAKAYFNKDNAKWERV